MQKQIFLYILLLGSILSSSLYAQTSERLKAEGEIPREFTTPSTVKYERQAAKIKSQKRRDLKNKKQFLLESGFAIDDLLQSGLVLFNDPISDYVNEVLQQLPVENRTLIRKKPRAYVLNTSGVNAFATDQGIILVTLGLLANLENEAQLAFILSHELMHIRHGHALDKFLKGKEISRDARDRNMRQVSFDKKLLDENMYSRQLEEEADEEGLELFLRSDYDPKKILNIFRILHYSYLPFDEVPFRRSFFEDENYVFRHKLWLNEVKPIPLMEDSEDDDARSSHPASRKRMKKMVAKILDKDFPGKKAFLLPAERFTEVQQRARYQVPFLELQDGNYADAVYTAYLILEDFPDDFEVQKVIGKALYMEAKYKNLSRFENKPTYGTKRSESRTIKGQSQRVYHLLSRMSHEEMNTFAVRYNWMLLKAHPEDEELQLLVEDLFLEFAKAFDDLTDFSDTTIPEEERAKMNEQKGISAAENSAEETPFLEETAIEELEEKELSKLGKIEANQQNQKTEERKERKHYWIYAFTDFLNEEDFRAAFAKGLEAKKERDKDEEFYESREGEDDILQREKKIARHGHQLGIDKVVVVNPFYLSLDERKKGVVQFVRSEEQQQFFRQKMKTVAKAAKIDATILDVTDLKSGEVAKFNDLAEINQYFGHQLTHDELSLTPSFNQNEINALAAKYDTDYFLWTGVISLRTKNRGVWSLIAVSLVVPYVAPLAIGKMVTPEYDMLYYAILFDVKTGRRSVIKMDYFEKRDSKAVLTSHMYDVFHQIKSVPKE